MKESTIIKLILLIILIALSSLFSASETAITSLNKARIKEMMDEKIPGAERIHKLVKDPEKLLSTILVGNNVVNIASSSLATSIAIKQFGGHGVGIATGIMTILLLIFSEITPKSLATRYPEKISLRLAKYLEFFTRILSPAALIFSNITNTILRSFEKIHRKHKSKTVISSSKKEEILEVDNRKIII